MADEPRSVPILHRWLAITCFFTTDPEDSKSMPSCIRDSLNRFRTVLGILAIAGLCAERCPAGHSRLIQVSDGNESWTGKVIAKDDSTCFLIDRFGVLSRIPVQSLKSFEVVSERFQAAPATEARERLRKEFPSGYEVAGSTHYLVCAPKGRAQVYVRLFDEIYRSVDQFFRVRGFATQAPETTLVAIVFGSQQEFADYCRRDKVAWSPGLRGYYSLLTNRVALFDDAELLRTTEAPRVRSGFHRLTQHDLSGGLRSEGPAFSVPGPGSGSGPGSDVADRAGLAAISGSAANTIIHETTHQVGHNIGIHSRTTPTPSWIIEGLATTLESPGQRQSSAGRDLKNRVNSERLEWFNGQYASRRSAGDVAKLIASDDPFRSQTLDAYSRAWALTFFMAENPARTQKYMSYLQFVRDRKSTAEYTAAERLQDFETYFGDIARVEVEFLRFMDRL